MDEMIFKPLVCDMTWSYSRLTAFTTCPYQWFLKYIHYPKIVEKKLFYSSYGKFLHHIKEKFNKGEFDANQAYMHFLMNYKDAVEGERPQEKAVENYINDAKAYLKNLKKLPYKIISVEEKLNFTFCDKPFVGIIDCICEDDDGELIIIDNKSRALKQRSKRKKPTKNDEALDEMLRQLYIYSEAVRQKYGKFPKLLCFDCMRNGEFISEPFNVDAYNATAEWVKSTIMYIENTNSFYPLLDFFYCRNLCDVQHECCYSECYYNRRR